MIEKEFPIIKKELELPYLEIQAPFQLFIKNHFHTSHHNPRTFRFHTA